MTEEQTEVADQQQVAVEEPKVDDSLSQEKPESNQSQNESNHNWKEANKVLKLQQQKIAELESRLNQPPPQPVVEEKDEFADLDPEDYLTVGKARQLAEKLAEKKAEAAAKKIVQEYVQQQTVQSDEARMRSKYEDYDYVVENYAIPLIKNDPAFAYKIQQSKNPAETAYKLGKLSDSYEESMTKQPISPKAEKILKNSQRPVSGNAVGSPLKTQSDQFSKMSRDEVWSMSQKYAKGA